MSHFLVDLLTLIVEDVYGELCSLVFKTLGKSGRLPLNPLVQKVPVSSKRVKAALAVLIQQHLISWNIVDGVTYYEIDVRNSYNVIRFGKIAQLFERRFGKGGKQIAEYIMVNGHVQTSQLIAEFEQTQTYRSKQKPKKLRTATGQATTTLNLDDEDDVGHKFDGIKSVYELKNLIRELLDADYVIPERLNLLKPIPDIQDDAERVIRETYYPKGPKGARETLDFKRQIGLLKRRWNSGEIGLGESAIAKKTKSSKLNVAALQSLSKVAVADTVTNGAADDVTLNMDIVLRLNEEKICVLMRNRQLVDMARRFLGETTSKVYEALLQTVEDQVPRCFQSVVVEAGPLDEEHESLPSTSSGAVLRMVDPNLNLYDGLTSEDSTPSLSRASSAFHDLDDDSISGNLSRLELVRTHLQVLSEDPREFVHWSAGESTEWHIDFNQLSEAMLSYEIENTIGARFSSSATRVVRVLRDRGRLDEKQISLLGMLPSKDARIVLNTMQEAGYVDVQEIPKEAARQTARSLWLWHFNDARCRRAILDDTYETMSRVLRRLEAYRSQFADVIEKDERAYASKSAGLLMTRAEKDSVATWKMAENKLLAQIHRLDDLVATLRDFYAYNPDTYLVS